MNKRLLLKITKWLIFVLAFVIIVIVGYVSYVSIQYYRLEDELVLDVSNNNSLELGVSDEYFIVTYNVGFGAYNHEFSFFMDSGEMLTGEKVAGTMAKAASIDVVNTNTQGSINTIMNENPDFVFLQEVDINANRSYHVNQYSAFREALSSFASSIAINFHSAYLFYPFQDPIGKTDSGITTFSKYQIKESTRYQLPIDNSFPNRFFDLDRSIMVTKVKTNHDKDLVLINVHLSAYDEGGIIRALQLETLKTIMNEEKNNFVIVGGDFNHDIASSLNLFTTTQKVPEWVYVFPEENLPEGYRFASATNVGTCRSTDMSYTKDVNYTVVIDGFIVNEYVTIKNVTNIDNDFVYSDHNPVKLTFGLVG